MTQGLNKEYGSIGAAAVVGGALSYLVTGRVFGAVTGGVAAALAVRLMHTQQRLADALRAPEPSAGLQGRFEELQRELYQERCHKMAAQRTILETTELLEELKLEQESLLSENSRQIQDLQGDLRRSKARVRRLEAELQNASKVSGKKGGTKQERAQIQSLKDDLHKARIEVSKQNEAIKAFKDELSTRKEELASARSMIDVNAEKITALKHKIEQLKSEKKKLEAALEKAEESHAEEIKDGPRATTALKERLDAKDRKIRWLIGDKNDLERALEEAEKSHAEEIVDKGRATADLTKKLDAKDREIQRLIGDKNDLQAALEKARRNVGKGNTSPGRFPADAFQREVTSSPLPGMGGATFSLFEKYKDHLGEIPGSNHPIWREVKLPPGTNRSMFSVFTIQMLLDSYGSPSWTSSSIAGEGSARNTNVTRVDNSRHNTSVVNSFNTGEVTGLGLPTMSTRGTGFMGGDKTLKEMSEEAVAAGHRVRYVDNRRVNRVIRNKNNRVFENGEEVKTGAGGDGLEGAANNFGRPSGGTSLSGNRPPVGWSSATDPLLSENPLITKHQAELYKEPGPDHRIWDDIALPPFTTPDMFRGFTIKMLIDIYGSPSRTSPSIAGEDTGGTNVTNVTTVDNSHNRVVVDGKEVTTDTGGDGSGVYQVD